MEDQREVGSLSRRTTRLRIRPITGRHSLAPSSFTRIAIVEPCGLSTLDGERYGLTVFRSDDTVV